MDGDVVVPRLAFPLAERVRQLALPYRARQGDLPSHTQW
jgi:hypothetical protein